jgi:hypothetical protein
MPDHFLSLINIRLFGLLVVSVPSSGVDIAVERHHH